MIITTTNSIQGKEITNYIDIVTATVYVNVYKVKGLSFKDSMNMIKAYENSEEGLEAAKRQSLENLKTTAKDFQAMAIIGLSMDVEVIRESMTMAISVMGTAVTYK